MKFSSALTLCAAPLALAGSLQVDLMKRGAVGVEVSQESSSSGSQKSNAASNSKNNNNNAAKGNAQSSTSITEVIILWVNNGGNAATSSVNSAQAVGTAAAATHTVRSQTIIHTRTPSLTCSGHCWWNCGSCLHAQQRCSCRWRYRPFHIHERQPHCHSIRFHHSL